MNGVNNTKTSIECLRTECWGSYIVQSGTRKQGNGTDYNTRSLMVWNPHEISIGWSKQEAWIGRGMYQIWGTGEVPTGCWGEEEPWGKCTLGKPRRRWQDNKTIDL